MKLLCECQLKKSKIVLFWTLVKHLILCGLVNISLYISGIEIKWGYFVVLWLCHFGNFSPLHTYSNSFWKCWFARADFISNSKVPPARQKLETLPLDRVHNWVKLFVMEPPRTGPCLDFGFQYALMRNNRSKKLEYWALPGSNSLWQPCVLDVIV